MRLITQSEPVSVYCSGAQNVNHLDELYDGRRPDIIDNSFSVVQFANGARAMLDLCMFAEVSRNQEEVRVCVCVWLCFDTFIGVCLFVCLFVCSSLLIVR